MSFGDTARVYDLLPAIHRLRDHEQGGVLEALVSVLARELGIVERDIDQLYENWFIETCDDWVVPYIGDLLGVRGLHPLGAVNYSRRAYVANTLAYRRRKGTATMLEQLARDVTGWPARAVEFFERLAATQYMNHVRPHARFTADLRDMHGLELLGGPFESAAHTLAVRRIGATPPDHRGRYNIPNIGIFLWRLQAYPVQQATAFEVQPGRFTFNPLGLDLPLYNAPQTETQVTQLADEVNVPGVLRRRALAEELEVLRAALTSGEMPSQRWFGEPPAFSLFLDEQNTPVPPEQLVICHLADWRLPPAALSYTDPDGVPVSYPIVAAVDPVLGRIHLASGTTADQLRVSYSYGFSGDYGGGPYDRSESVAAWYDPFVRPVTWQRGVVLDPDVLAAAPDPAQLTDSLEDAVDAWNVHSAANADAFGVIAIMDSRTHAADLVTHEIEIRAGSRLAIVAADWPLVTPPGGNAPERTTGRFVPVGLRPHVRGDVQVVGLAGTGSDHAGELILDGLLVEGKLTVADGNLGRLRLAHTTLVPAAGGLDCTQGNARLEIAISHAITGAITLDAPVPRLEAAHTIVDGEAAPALSAPGADVGLDRCTVIGSAAVRTLEASEAIFTAPVVAERRQTGCVRFSFVPTGSKTGRRYRCQPQLEIAARIEAAEKENNGPLTALEEDEIRERVIARIRPAFVSLRYGDAAYAQLTLDTPEQIRNGAEDGGEMGVFHDLLHPQREANLRASLDEYLRAGLSAGIFHVS